MKRLLYIAFLLTLLLTASLLLVACEPADELEHTATEAVRENDIPATCTADGSYDTVIYCDECGVELSRLTVTVKAGHVSGEPTRKNEIPATCTTEGSYDEVVYCDECGEIISEKSVTVEALGHTPLNAVRENEIPATCTTEGSYDEVVYCDECGEEISRTNKVAVTLPHTPLNAVRENVISASCTKLGSCDEVVYCNECGVELSRDAITLQMIPHDYDGVYCTVCGAERESSEGLEFTLNSDGKSYTLSGVGSFTGKELVVTTYKGLPVTVIGGSFFFNSEIEKIILGDHIGYIYACAGECLFQRTEFYKNPENWENGLLYIGKYLIYSKADGLYENVSVKDGTELIASFAFAAGPLKNIHLPDSVRIICGGAFAGCRSLKSITLPEGVTDVEWMMFEYCTSLESITFSKNVSSISWGVFNGCTSLKSINVDFDNSVYKSVDGNLYSKDGKTLLQYAIGKADESFVIPDGVVTVGSGAFADCAAITSVTVSSDVSRIEKFAFNRCTALTGVYFNDTSTWYVERWSYGADEIDVSNAATNADHLTDSYTSYPWHKE